MVAGNHILPDEDLYSFYIELLSRADPNKPAKVILNYSSNRIKELVFVCYTDSKSLNFLITSSCFVMF